MGISCPLSFFIKVWPSGIFEVGEFGPFVLLYSYITYIELHVHWVSLFFYKKDTAFRGFWRNILSKKAQKQKANKTVKKRHRVKKGTPGVFPNVRHVFQILCFCVCNKKYYKTFPHVSLHWFDYSKSYYPIWLYFWAMKLNLRLSWWLTWRKNRNVSLGFPAAVAVGPAGFGHCQSPSCRCQT